MSSREFERRKLKNERCLWNIQGFSSFLFLKGRICIQSKPSLSLFAFIYYYPWPFQFTSQSFPFFVSLVRIFSLSLSFWGGHAFRFSSAFLHFLAFRPNQTYSAYFAIIFSRAARCSFPKRENTFLMIATHWNTRDAKRLITQTYEKNHPRDNNLNTCYPQINASHTSIINDEKWQDSPQRNGDWQNICMMRSL